MVALDSEYLEGIDKKGQLSHQLFDHWSMTSQSTEPWHLDRSKRRDSPVDSPSQNQIPGQLIKIVEKYKLLQFLGSCLL